MVRSLAGAAAWVERVGIALVFPKADSVLPSLWEAIAGQTDVAWAVRDEDGKFVSFSPEFDRIWRWKDELPERRLACVGRHLARSSVAVSPALIAPLYALTGRNGRADDFRAVDSLTPLQRELAEAVLESGPCSTPELRRLVGTDDKKAVDAAVEGLQRLCVLTNAGIDDREPGWPAVKQDVFARRWRQHLRRLPAADDARHELAGRVLAAAREVSAADVAAVLGWRRREASGILDALVDRGLARARDEDRIRLWTPRRARR